MSRKTPRPKAAPTPLAPILFCSNHPAAMTGYGQQSEQLVSRMAAQGYRVAIASNYGTEGHVANWRGVRVYPRGFAPYSDDVVVAYAKNWAHENGAEPLVMTLFDVWPFNDFPSQVGRVASWVPIDHEPAPAKVIKWLAQPNVTPIAMSKFGERMIGNAGLDCRYAPHAINTKIFAPTPTIKGVRGRDIMGGIPDDAFVIGMNAANKGYPDRKGWAPNLMAASALMHKHDDVWLYLHCEPTGIMQGLNLFDLLAAVGAPMDRVRIIEQFTYRMGLPQEPLAAIYTGMDVLLSCSLGEGFGIPVIEAQATGTPVVVTNWTAQPELVGDGYTVGGQPYWDAPQGSWWMTPSVAEIIGALEALYDRGQGRSQKAIDFAAQYDADAVYEQHWKPILHELTA